MVYDIGSVGVMADAQYRLNLRATAGVSYSFSDFIYPGSLSSTRYHSVSGNYALALSRRTEFSVSGGFLKSESRFLEAIPLDPILAYLIGMRSTVVVNHQIRNLPSGGARLSRSFSRGSAYLSGGYSVVPGNGLFLATVAAYVSGGYSYTGLQRWNLSAGGSYSEGKSIGTSLGHYGSSGANFSASRQAQPVHPRRDRFLDRSVSKRDRLLLQPLDLPGEYRHRILPRQYSPGAAIAPESAATAGARPGSSPPPRQCPRP